MSTMTVWSGVPRWGAGGCRRRARTASSATRCQRASHDAGIVGIGPEERYRLITAYPTDLSTWCSLHWLNLHGPKRKQRVSLDPAQPGTATLTTYRTLAKRYITHPEVKALGPYGQPCERDAIGVLSRRHVDAGRIVTIGKRPIESMTEQPVSWTSPALIASP